MLLYCLKCRKIKTIRLQRPIKKKWYFYQNVQHAVANSQSLSKNKKQMEHKVAYN